MDDLGAPVSYLALARGAAVYDVDGKRVGTVAHVLADDGADIFDGIVIDCRRLLGGHRFADADQIAALYERGVTLKVRRDVLHEPVANPAVLSVDPDDTAAATLTDRLRRAWESLSGRR